MKLTAHSVLLTSLFSLYIIFGVGFSAVAQNDSLDVKIFGKDDLSDENFQQLNQVSSANRLAENPEDLAQEIIIIDGDDIRKFGYSTLVDVLKSIPGFRTSQPGNAVEGETFLMRGLYGNDHTKIMINGIPIKPEAAKGMPIAAQLPIRHAERIEIVMGPSSSSNGSDAMAGVINIVLPEIDRPVFAWADVNILTPKSTEFNLTLGGKVGQGQQILNYEIFASSQQADDVNLLIPDDSIRVDFDLDPALNQLTDEQLAIYVGDPDDKSLPEIQSLRRESRLLGAYFKYRWFEFSAINMYRVEHSGFGTNPLNASYHNPGNTFGENINSYSLKYNGTGTKKFSSYAALSFLSYRTLENSSYFGVTNFMSNGRNFMYARSNDFRADYQGVWKINPLMKLAVGATANYSVSHPFTSYLERQFRKKDESTFNLEGNEGILATGGFQNPNIDAASYIDSTQTIEKYTTFNVGPFVQYLYKSKSGKVNLELGTRMDFNGNEEAVFSPRAGLVYRPNKKLRIMTYYGEGYRAPRSYNIYNNYSQAAGDFATQPLLKRDTATLKSEELKGAELRVNWKLNEDWNISGRYYFHSMENRVMREISDPKSADSTMSPIPIVGVGFFNGESYSFLNAGMVAINYKKKFNKMELDMLAAYEFSRGWEYFIPDDDNLDVVIKSAAYRFAPEHSFRGNLNLTINKFTLSIRNKVFGNFVTEIFRLNNQIQYSETDKIYYNLDMLMHVRMFRQLSLFVGAYNVLSSVQSGIPNVNISNSWTYNPQYGRTFKFGLNFQLN